MGYRVLIVDDSPVLMITGNDRKPFNESDLEKILGKLASLIER